MCVGAFIEIIIRQAPDLFSKNRTAPWLVKRIEDIEARVHSVYEDYEMDKPEHEREGQVHVTAASFFKSYNAGLEDKSTLGTRPFGFRFQS